MENQYPDEKEDTFHDSHTNRYSYYNEVTSPSILIDRPENIEGDIITKSYCQIDDFLVENNQRIDHTCQCTNGQSGQKCCRKSMHWISLKVPHEEIIELLESECTAKSIEYDNWYNSTSVTYSVPSTYEVDVIREKKDIKPKFAYVDGKLYERDMIYHYNASSHTWQPSCHRNIPLPVFKTASDKIERKIIPLKISSLTCSDPEVARKNKSNDHWWRPRGILHHDTPWSWGYSMHVAGDVVIDLGQPQIVTHIGTVGSFLPTRWYPEHLNSTTRLPYTNRKSRSRRKFSHGISVEDTNASQSWCASYRVMYKKSVGDPYTYAGVYKANQNSYELVVNDLRSNMPSVPIRYLLLKPTSNKPKNKHFQKSCAMSIAVYGKVPEVPKQKLLLDDSEMKNEVQLIRYTVCVPPTKQVRVKQSHGNCHNYCDYGVTSKEKAKQQLRKEIEDESYDNYFNCGCLFCFDPFGRDDYYDYWSMYEEQSHYDSDDWEDWSEEQHAVYCSDAGRWKEFDSCLDDVNMWPPLPTVSCSSGSVSTEGESSPSDDVSTVTASGERETSEGDENMVDQGEAEWTGMDVCSNNSNAASSQDSWELI